MTIDLIIPVYRGLTETRRCIESVLASSARDLAEVVVIDDASPEPEVCAYLDALAANGDISLSRNPRNIGFVGTANLGLARSPDRDVILLNSDTEVTGTWLARLRQAAYRAPDIGTVTPFSNNATICSYPFPGWEGGVPGSLGLKQLDALFARENHGQLVDLPTAVGFCMYLRRECIRQVGMFDEARFGRGYGEENDFCMRAASLGWRNVLATDIYVFHEGSVSFGAERFALQKAAMEALLDKHPTYLQQVGSFIACDPAAPFRSRIDTVRSGLDDVEAGHVGAEAAQRAAKCR